MTFHTHPESGGELASGEAALTYGSGDWDDASGEPEHHNSDTLYLAIGLLVAGVLAVALPALVSALRSRRGGREGELPVVKGVPVSAVERAPLLRIPVLISSWGWDLAK